MAAEESEIGARHLDHRATTGHGSETPVCRNQHRLKHLRERDVRCIVSREVIAQLPDAIEKRLMGIASEVELVPVLERQRCSASRQHVRSDITPKNLGDFQVDQMWSVNGATVVS